MGRWRGLHNKELHDSYSSPKTRRMRWAGHVAQMEKRITYRFLVEKPD
jgi:hypothetical protein